MRPSSYVCYCTLSWVFFSSRAKTTVNGVPLACPVLFEFRPCSSKKDRFATLHFFMAPPQLGYARRCCGSGLCGGVQTRSFYVPMALIVLLVFTGLLVSLWAWKCVVVVIFQDKIIDMPSMPPFSRSVKIAGYEAVCRSVVWREERVKSGDGVEVALAVGGRDGREQWGSVGGEGKCGGCLFSRACAYRSMYSYR